nr:Arm DNA-binding domain-containing protein [Bacillus pumilus]
MHFKELVKGKKWLAVGDGPPDPVTGKRKQIPRRGKTKKEAEQRVLKAIATLEEDGIDESVVKKMTFDKLANEWLEDYMKVSGNKDNTFRIRKTEIKILNRKFAKLNISKLTTRLYQKGLNELSEELSLNTLKGVHAANWYDI